MYLAIPGIAELWPILLIVVILFGATKLPALARAMGSSVTQFKKGLKDDGAQPEELEGGADSQEAGSKDSGSEEGGA